MLLDCFVDVEYDPVGYVRLCVSVSEGLWVRQSSNVVQIADCIAGDDAVASEPLRRASRDSFEVA